MTPPATATQAGELITVTFPDGSSTSCHPSTHVRELFDGTQDEQGLHYICANVNNDIVSLSYPLEVDSHVELLTLKDHRGLRIYRRSVCFLLAKAVRELFPDATFAVEHSLSTGFYCSFSLNGDKSIRPEQLDQIEQRMHDFVTSSLQIKRMKISYEAAVAQFENEQQRDKLNLLRFRNPPKVVIYSCDGFSDLAHGPLVHDTAALTTFKLIPYEPGFVVQFPDEDNPTQLAPFEEQPHLFRIFQEHKEWGRILGVQTVGDLNEIIKRGEIAELVKISEAFHEKKFAALGDHIHQHMDRVRWILIAGPSSAGKTTSAKRLAVHLKVNGIRPVLVSVDNYFVDRENTPLTEAGDYDFENIETIDLPLLNDHMQRLDRGEEVEIPRFNFEHGRREFRDDKLKLADDQMLIMEGIHCLNPRLTEGVPNEHKFKIYVSALTQLNLDSNNRISTTDNRLIRRMVRDNMFRGNDALETLKMWPNVRHGEKRWIFPFQQEADVALNSALDYELAILKPLAEPLLAEVKPDQPQYAEARRLQDFLSSLIALNADLVPRASVLREFIGESSFRY